MNYDTNTVAPLIKMISEAMERNINSVLRQYDLTYSQARVLYILYQNPQKDFSLKELEKIFHVSQQTMAGIINRIADKMFVNTYVAFNDKRMKRVALTENGEKILVQVKEKTADMNEILLEGMAEEEKEMLLNFLKKVYANILKQ